MYTALIPILPILALATAFATPSVRVVHVVHTSAIADAAPVQVKRDSMTVTIDPAKRIEVKLVMKKGEKADFEWRSTADVGYNLHGEVPTDPSVKAHIYARGSSKGEKGNIVAEFDGVHGWSWRNNTEQPVTVTVKASGQFSALKKM